MNLHLLSLSRALAQATWTNREPDLVGLAFLVGLVLPCRRRQRYRWYMAFLGMIGFAVSNVVGLVVFSLVHSLNARKHKWYWAAVIAWVGAAGVAVAEHPVLRREVLVWAVVGLAVIAAVVGSVTAWRRLHPPVLDPQRFATPQMRAEVLARYGNRCASCGVSGDAPGVQLEMDHIVPWSRGGGTRIDNLQPLCGPCNRAKSDHMPAKR